MEYHYFINVLLEVDMIKADNPLVGDMRKVGNLFDNEEDAHRALGRIKLAIAER